MKEELQYKKEQIEYLTKENQCMRHDLMTLRHEVRDALTEVNHDLFEGMSLGDLDVDPLIDGMSWNESSFDKPGDAYKFLEGRQILKNSNAPAGEDYEGPSPSQLVNMPTIPQPGSKPMPNILNEAELEEIGHFDYTFEKKMASGSNPMSFPDSSLSNINIDDFTVDISGLDTNLIEYKNMTFDKE